MFPFNHPNHANIDISVLPNSHIPLQIINIYLSTAMELGEEEPKDTP